MNTDTTTKPALLIRFALGHWFAGKPVRLGLQAPLWFLTTLLALVIMVVLSFAARAAQQAPETGPLEIRMKAPSERSFDSGPGGQRDKEEVGEVPMQRTHSPKAPESSPAVQTHGTDRARPSEHESRHNHDKFSLNGQTRSGTAQNLHLPALNNSSSTMKEEVTPTKMQHQQRSQEVRPPPLQLSSPVTDSLHSRISTPAHLGGPSSTAKDNAALNGLNGTGMKRKP